jgi:hypothetical protein
MDDIRPKETPADPNPGYEAQEVDIRRVVLIGLVFLALLIASLIVVDQFFTVEKERVVENVVLKPESISLRELRAKEDEALNSYKVLDSEQGVYRIPINRAMELIANEAFERSRASAEQ